MGNCSGRKVRTLQSRKKKLSLEAENVYVPPESHLVTILAYCRLEESYNTLCWEKL